MERTMYVLDQKDMPTHWYNIQADLPEPLPPLLHPGTKEPTRLPPPLFAEALNEQEFSKERWIEIPGGSASYLPHMETNSTASSVSAGEGLGHTGKNLLQI